jgi:hypothetical protein
MVWERRCCAINCKNKRTTEGEHDGGETRAYYKFPANDDRANKWLVEVRYELYD